MVCDCHNYQTKMMTLQTVLDSIGQAAHNKQGFSLTRFSHGEISYLSYKINPVLVRNYEKYRTYTGLTESIEKAAAAIKHSLETTDIAGFVPKDCADNGEWWYSNTKQVLHHLNILPPSICSVWITQEMIYHEQFWQLLRQRRVALIGRRAEEASHYFGKNGVNITEVKNLDGVDEIKPVHDHMKNSSNWDIALISAAVPATILTPILAQDAKRIVIDFGHAMDLMIDGDKFDFQKIVEEWGKKQIDQKYKKQKYSRYRRRYRKFR